MALKRALGEWTDNVVSLFPAKARHQGWTALERAEFYRVNDMLVRAGLAVETDEGLTDEGEPWFVFCHAETGDVIVHFARLSGRFVAVSSALPQSISSTSFPDLVQRMGGQLPLVMPTAKPGQGSVFVHPAALLVAAVATLFFKSTALETDEGDPHRDSLTRMSTNVQATSTSSSGAEGYTIAMASVLASIVAIRQEWDNDTELWAEVAALLSPAERTQARSDRTEASVQLDELEGDAAEHVETFEDGDPASLEAAMVEWADWALEALGADVPEVLLNTMAVRSAQTTDGKEPALEDAPVGNTTSARDIASKTSSETATGDTLVEKPVPEADEKAARSKPVQSDPAQKDTGDQGQGVNDVVRVALADSVTTINQGTTWSVTRSPLYEMRESDFASDVTETGDRDLRIAREPDDDTDVAGTKLSVAKSSLVSDEALSQGDRDILDDVAALDDDLLDVSVPESLTWAEARSSLPDFLDTSLDDGGSFALLAILSALVANGVGQLGVVSRGGDVMLIGADAAADPALELALLDRDDLDDDASSASVESLALMDGVEIRWIGLSETGADASTDAVA